MQKQKQKKSIIPSIKFTFVLMRCQRKFCSADDLFGCVEHGIAQCSPSPINAERCWRASWKRATALFICLRDKMATHVDSLTNILFYNYIIKNCTLPNWDALNIFYLSFSCLVYQMVVWNSGVHRHFGGAGAQVEKKGTWE